jgi:hypothetical protein
VGEAWVRAQPFCRTGVPNQPQGVACWRPLSPMLACIGGMYDTWISGSDVNSFYCDDLFSVPSGFLVVFEKPYRSSFAFTFHSSLSLSAVSVCTCLLVRVNVRLCTGDTEPSWSRLPNWVPGAAVPKPRLHRSARGTCWGLGTGTSLKASGALGVAVPCVGIASPRGSLRPESQRRCQQAWGRSKPGTKAHCAQCTQSSGAPCVPH